MMLKNASFTREVQRRANEEYEKYNKMKQDVSHIIMFASCIGMGECDFKIPYSTANVNFTKKIEKELFDLGYVVNAFKTPSIITLHISW